MSWIIKNKQTGEVMLEIFSQKLLARLNTEKYEAVPAMAYLVGEAKRLKEAAAEKSEAENG